MPRSCGVTTAGRPVSRAPVNSSMATMPRPPAPPRRPTTMAPDTAGLEIDGFNALWIEDYGRAAQLFDDVAAQLGDHPEHRAFWLASRALALQLLARFGDRAAGHEAEAALADAATSGARNTFFTRLRLSASRRAATSADIDGSQLDGFFEASDDLVDRHGASGPRFERWATGLLEGPRSNDHDTLARSIARFGSEVLGLAAEAPRATSGEPDAIWSLVGPYRELTFEVKMAPTTQRVANDDVEQIESATRAIEFDSQPPGAWAAHRTVGQGRCQRHSAARASPRGGGASAAAGLVVARARASCPIGSPGTTSTKCEPRRDSMWAAPSGRPRGPSAAGGPQGCATTQRVANDDVEQIESATRAIESNSQPPGAWAAHRAVGRGRCQRQSAARAYWPSEPGSPRRRHRGDSLRSCASIAADGRTKLLSASSVAARWRGECRRWIGRGSCTTSCPIGSPGSTSTRCEPRRDSMWRHRVVVLEVHRPQVVRRAAVDSGRGSLLERAAARSPEQSG